MMGASGFRKNRETNARQVRFRTWNAIITLSENIRASEISRRAISHREAQKKFAMKAAASARVAAAFTWISQTQSLASERKRSANAMEISSTSTKRSRARMRMSV